MALNDSKNIALITLGAPRSGLAVLTNCLGLVGIKPISGDNPGADLSPSQINLLLFQELGSNPYTVETLPGGWLQSHATLQAARRIRELIVSAGKDNGPFVISDPFLCLLFPLWQGVLKELGYGTRIIHMVRHPWEVARSLTKSENVDFQTAHLHWLHSNRQALLACGSHVHTRITFDQLLADPVSIISEIARNLNLYYEGDSSRLYDSLLKYVQPRLKHEHAGSADNAYKKEFHLYLRIYNAFRLAKHQGAVAYETDDFPPEDSYSEINNASQITVQHTSSRPIDSLIRGTPSSIPRCFKKLV
ncbi:MAG: hypothetical protein K9J85_11135 [Desulfobacteraceae bacterium]|nr:hypothetical protein [Desulfobacteraceae bacterium]